MIQLTPRVTRLLLVFSAVIFSAAMPAAISLWMFSKAQDSFALCGAVYLGSLVITLVVGLPLATLFERFGYANWWSSILCGALVGVAILATVFRRHIEYGTVTLFAAAGASAAFVFFIFWRARIPKPPKKIRHSR